MPAPKCQGDRQDNTNSGTSRRLAGAAATFNSNPDKTLLKRFQNSEHSSISAMMEGKEVTIPKHANKDVCLVWALKGECSATCKRKDQHVRYSKDTLNKIGELLDACGVPPTQG